ncbi:hypothetical protein ACLOJK_003683 [Asimina triloba]
MRAICPPGAALRKSLFTVGRWGESFDLYMKRLLQGESSLLLFYVYSPGWWLRHGRWLRQSSSATPGPLDTCKL